MIRTNNKYLNDIKYNGNSINRIYLNGEVYLGNEPEPDPSPPVPTHLIHGTTISLTTGTFDIGINNSDYAATKNVPVYKENGEFWLDELPSNIGTITSLAGCFNGISHITSIDTFNIDTTYVQNWRAWLGPGSQCTYIGKFNLDFTHTLTMWDGCNYHGAESVDLSGWKMNSNISNIRGTFAECPNLKHIDVSNWQLKLNVTITDVFYNTRNLIDVTMNNASDGTFDAISRALARKSYTRNVKIYRDGDIYVYSGGQWIIENS